MDAALADLSWDVVAARMRALIDAAIAAKPAREPAVLTDAQ